MAFLKDLLVTGGARFLNTIQGNITSANSVPNALESNGTTATTTPGTTYGVAGITSGTRIYAKWYINLNTNNQTLTDGLMIAIKIPVAGCSSGSCITIDGTNFHPVVLNTNSIVTTHFPVGTKLLLMYDATQAASVYGNITGTGATTTANITGTWRVMNSYNTNDNTVPSAYCSTAAGTAAKTATCSGYYLLDKSYIHVIVTNTNTVVGAITLNINGQGAKPIYINGKASAADNYNLPRGSYIVYYDGTNYYFNTNGNLPGRIGAAAGVDQTAVTASDYTNWRTLIFGASNSGTEGFIPTTQSGGALYATNVLSVQPSTGTIRARNFKAISGNFTAANTGFGLYLTDSASNQYAGIYDNGTNLWVGATSSDGMHHKGTLFLSAGYTGTIGQSGVAATTGAYLSFPTFDTSFKINGHTSRIIVNGTAGNATTPVFINSNGQPTTITSYGGNAATASKVYMTATNPSTGTLYAVPFHSGTNSENKSVLTNDGIGYWTKEGTTSEVGVGELKLGNNIASGTAGNKKGLIYMYGTSSGYSELIPGNNTTSNVILTLPSSTGTIALTSSNITGNAATATTATKLGTADIGSETKGIYLKAGVPTAMTYELSATVNTGTANRVAYYSGTNAINSTGHFSNASKMAINSTAEPTTTLYVNGTAQIGGNLTPAATRTHSLGSSTLFWNSPYLFAGGKIHLGNFTADAVGGAIWETTSTTYGWPAFSWYSGAAYGNKLFGLPAEAITFEYTTNNGTTWVEDTTRTDDNKRAMFCEQGFNLPVGGLASYDAGSGNVATDQVGYGCRVTADFSVDNRAGTLSQLQTYWRLYNDECLCTIESYNAYTKTWTTLRSFTATNSDQYRQLYTASNLRMDGARVNRDGSIHKLRWTLITKTKGTTTNNRYAPAINNMIGFGPGSISFSSGTVTPSGGTATIFKYGTRLAYDMARYNTPISLANKGYNTGGIGAARIGCDLYIGDDYKYTAANTEKWSTLYIGNAVNVNAENAHSQGRIYLYSAATKAHIIRGTSTTTDYSHYFPNQSGWIATGGNGTSTGVGSTSQPIYLDVDGKLKVTTYSLSATINSGTANKIAYYSGTNAISSGSINTDGSYLRNIGGYNNDSYALSAASAIINSWIRTVGSTGWYNETHTGGWYMIDTNWIRSYNNKKIFLGRNTAADSNNLSSQLVISSLAFGVADGNSAAMGTTAGGNVAIELWRGSNASWQIINTSGNLQFKNNYTTTKQATYSQSSLSLSYNTGAGSIPYLAVNSAATTDHRLYVNGNAKIKGSMFVSTDDVYTAWNSAANGSWIGSGEFGIQRTSAGGGYYLESNGVQVGRLYSSELGTVGTGTANGTTGVAWLMLGNTTAVTTSSTAGANNSRGAIRLYGANTNSTSIYAQANGNRDLYLPNYAGTMYMIHAGSNSAVGGETQPVYIAANGRATATTYSLSSNVNSGTIKRLAHYSSATTVSAASNISFESTTATVNGASGVEKSILRLWGTCYGNEATPLPLTSKTIGVLSYGDGGPQIQFSSGENDGQNGALIYTTHDAAGSGVSWHFVSDQSDWNVNSKRFVAKTSVTVGRNVPQTSYNFFVDGSSYFKGKIHLEGNSYGTSLPSSGTAGQIFFVQGAVTGGGGSELAYLRLTGGTMSGQIQKASNNQTWVTGREGALIKNTDTAYTNNRYNPLWSVKSINGTWDCGTFTTNNSLFFTYITDANYNAGTNTSSAQIEFRGSDNSVRANKVYGAVWNDYAEYREVFGNVEAGRCVIETGLGNLVRSKERLAPGANIISDTYGFAIGETDSCTTPIAVSGRVLAYPYEDRSLFRPGDPVCSGPNGTISLMTREEVRNYPERIIGTVSEIPVYKIWGPKDIQVNGRIWIKVK